MDKFSNYNYTHQLLVIKYLQLTTKVKWRFALKFSVKVLKV